MPGRQPGPARTFAFRQFFAASSSRSTTTATTTDYDWKGAVVHRSRRPKGGRREELGVVPVPRRPHFSISAFSQKRPAPTGLPRAARTGSAPTGLPRGGERLGKPRARFPERGKSPKESAGRPMVLPRSSPGSSPTVTRPPRPNFPPPTGQARGDAPTTRSPPSPVPVSAFQHFSISAFSPKRPPPTGQARGDAPESLRFPLPTRRPLSSPPIVARRRPVKNRA